MVSLKPSERLIENKKLLLKIYAIKTIFFQRHNKLSDWSEIEGSV